MASVVNVGGGRQTVVGAPAWLGGAVAVTALAVVVGALEGTVAIVVVGVLGILALLSFAVTRWDPEEGNGGGVGTLLELTAGLHGAEDLDQIRTLTCAAAAQLLGDASWVDVHIGDASVPATSTSVVATSGSQPTVSILAEGHERLLMPQRRLLEVLALSASRAASRVGASQRADDHRRLASTILAAISHDLRSPMATVIGSTHTLERHVDAMDPRQRSQLLGAVRRSATRVDDLVNDLLTLQRLEYGGMEGPPSVNVSALLSSLVEEIDGVEVHSDGRQDLRAPIQPAVLHRVLDNLVTNAAKHAPQCPVWVRWWSDDDAIVIAVEDAGPGIAPADRERLLRPFERGQGAIAGRTSGVGLGLYLTQRFVELSGGQLVIEEAEAGGASFQIHLPVGADDTRVDSGGLSSAA